MRAVRPGVSADASVSALSLVLSSKLIVAATANEIGPGRALVPSYSSASVGAVAVGLNRAHDPGPVRQKGATVIAGLGAGSVGSTERAREKIVLTWKSLTIGTPVLYRETMGLKASPPKRRFSGSYTQSSARVIPYLARKVVRLGATRGSIIT